MTPAISQIDLARSLRTKAWMWVLIVVLAMGAPAVLASDTEINRSFDVGNGGLLVVDAEGASIQVRTVNNGEASFRISRRGGAPIADDYDVEITQNGDRVSLVIDRKKRIAWGRNRGLEAEITVPDIFDAEIKSAGGSVSVQSLRGEVVVDSSGGSVTLGEIDGPVDIDTSGGSIEVAAVTGEAVLETSGGSIQIGDIHDAIRASTSGGSVSVVLTRTPGGSSKLSTSGGSIRLRLASGVGLDLDAVASGGSVSSSVDVDVLEKSRTRLVGSVGGGGPSMVLRSSGGGIRISADD